eukprot:21171-Pyramimonas_sp.AAC.1
MVLLGSPQGLSRIPRRASKPPHSPAPLGTQPRGRDGAAALGGQVAAPHAPSGRETGEGRA